MNLRLNQQRFGGEKERLQHQAQPGPTGRNGERRGQLCEVCFAFKQRQVYMKELH